MKSYYVIQHPSGDLIAVDYHSGGYPYRVGLGDWPQAKLWNSAIEARAYAKIVNHDDERMKEIHRNLYGRDEWTIKKIRLVVEDLP